MSVRRSARPSPENVIRSSRCPDCGKMRYESKADAKKSQRQQGRQNSRYYRCGDYWHATNWVSAENVRAWREYKAR